MAEANFLVDYRFLDAIQNEVSGERAWDMVSKISRFHRIRGGGEGSDYNNCVEWLAGELGKVKGLEVRVEKFATDGEKKYLGWLAPIGWRVKEAELWLLEPEERLLARFSNMAVSLMPYSKGGKAESEVVFVGGGKKDEDYEGVDVKGKLVFAVGGDGAKVHREAVIKRGAAGVIVGPTGRADRLNYLDLVEVSRLSPKKEEVKDTGFGFALSLNQTRELESYFRDGKTVRMRAWVDAELIEGEMPTIDAWFPGSEHPEQEVILMGHLDHYKPGANDNASGCAGMVEIIRNIASMVEKGVIEPPRRTIRFLFLPELHGAAAYLSRYPDIGERGIAGINLDMIGENYTLCHSYFRLTCSPYSVPGYITDVLANLLKWLEGKNFFSPRGSKQLFNFRIRPHSIGSDHVMFNASTFSIPTASLGHPDIFHHTNMDTLDKCDPTELKRIISLTEAASIFLANADDEDALNIAREVYSQAHIRMTEGTNKTLPLLHQYTSNPEKNNKLAKFYWNAINYPQVQSRMESANLIEIKELCQKETSKIIIDKLAEDLNRQAIREKDKINILYELILNRYNLEKEQFLPDDIYKKASSLKPKTLFKGTLLHEQIEDHLMEKLDDENFNWYNKNREKARARAHYYGSHNGNLGLKMFEILNLMDGNRTLLDIRHIVSCEFDETNIELIVHLAEDLEAVGLIKF